MKYTVPTQAITSANTSINAKRLPAVFTKVDFKPFTTNLDIGGGKFDNATEHLETKGVESKIYDPFNRSTEHNESVLDWAVIGGVDTVTCSNVLNVISEHSARLCTISLASDVIKKGGKAYFSIYEGNKSGIGKATKAGYQNNKKTNDYIFEINTVFPFAVVTRKGNIITVET